MLDVNSIKLVVENKIHSRQHNAFIYCFVCSNDVTGTYSVIITLNGEDKIIIVGALILTSTPT